MDVVIVVAVTAATEVLAILMFVGTAFARTGTAAVDTDANSVVISFRVSNGSGSITHSSSARGDDSTSENKGLL